MGRSSGRTSPHIWCALNRPTGVEARACLLFHTVAASRQREALALPCPTVSPLRGCGDFGFWVLGRAAALVWGVGSRSGPDSWFWAAQRRLNPASTPPLNTRSPPQGSRGGRQPLKPRHEPLRRVDCRGTRGHAGRAQGSLPARPRDRRRHGARASGGLARDCAGDGHPLA